MPGYGQTRRARDPSSPRGHRIAVYGWHDFRRGASNLGLSVLKGLQSSPLTCSLMSAEKRFRTEEWNPTIEEQLFKKLRRARDKAQYLQIQAECFSATHPLRALALLEKLLADGSDRLPIQSFPIRTRSSARCRDGVLQADGLVYCAIQWPRTGAC